MLKSDAILILNDSTEVEIKPVGDKFTAKEIKTFMNSTRLMRMSSLDGRSLIIDLNADSSTHPKKNIRACIMAFNSTQKYVIRGRAILCKPHLVEHLFTPEPKPEPDENPIVEQAIQDKLDRNE